MANQDVNAKDAIETVEQYLSNYPVSSNRITDVVTSSNMAYIHGELHRRERFFPDRDSDINGFDFVGPIRWYKSGFDIVYSVVLVDDGM
ncbi:hypothetical protein GRX03_01060 [Halovenus sp. WSH3]|uniref:Uncharacterized protein n=1 Tax=Halovenus carboxidivorans TaxID=2692199 RepID=A0A6B0T5N2_9EURY|nr:hypothetical protein [Halovenus carboxidivorans]MXR50200.1 hypothetical protein [Halovenus carboxidivorans]